MNRADAWWILRAQIEMTDEGIGVGHHTDSAPEDEETLREAFRIAGDLVPSYDRSVFEYLT